LVGSLACQHWQLPCVAPGGPSGLPSQSRKKSLVEPLASRVSK
jgi:hypothetical protein